MWWLHFTIALPYGTEVQVRRWTGSDGFQQAVYDAVGSAICYSTFRFS